MAWSGQREISSTLRTGPQEDTERPGTIFKLRMRWYSMDGMMPASASLARSRSAQREGTVYST